MEEIKTPGVAQGELVWQRNAWEMVQQLVAIDPMVLTGLISRYVATRAICRVLWNSARTLLLHYWTICLQVRVWTPNITTDGQTDNRPTCRKAKSTPVEINIKGIGRSWIKEEAAMWGSHERVFFPTSLDETWDLTNHVYHQPQWALLFHLLRLLHLSWELVNLCDRYWCTWIFPYPVLIYINIFLSYRVTPEVP